MLHRAVAVELETTKELNKLLYSVESAYLNIVREVAEYAVANNVLSATQLHGLFYSRYRLEYPSLNSQLVLQAIKQASEIAKSFVKRRRKGLVNKPYPEVRSVSIRFVETTWNYKEFTKSVAPVRVWISPISTGKRGAGGRFEVWLRLHKRFWFYWWRVLSGEAELASTLVVKRRLNKWYAIFIFELKPKEEEPKSVVTFDINENTVAVSRIDIIATIDKIASWNRQYLMPQLYTIETNFGKLARGYERIRNAIIERLKSDFLLPNGNYVNVTNTREYRKLVRKLREEDRKLDRVRQIANELTKTPAIIITEELGSNPQESMIEDVGRSELRHRIKQIPFKNIEKTVGDKALERGSKIFRVSSYRNSRVCPIHFVRLEKTDDWHVLYCPKGHYVHRDYASVINMNWKLTPESWTKGVWWNMKLEMNWREHEEKSNPIILKYIIQHLYAILKTLTASEQSPAMLARGKPMNPAGGANEGWARKPPKKEEVSKHSPMTSQTHTHGKQSLKRNMKQCLGAAAGIQAYDHIH
ncbi:MAG: zinc ribbon domain-containing protein [Vulcanisaeta sp.]